MLAQAIVEFFKVKTVSSIIILSCWPVVDRVKLINKISQLGTKSTFSNGPNILEEFDLHRLQGVLYIKSECSDEKILRKVQPLYFMPMFKWLVIGDGVPDILQGVRYDADITFISQEPLDNNSKSTAYPCGDGVRIQFATLYSPVGVVKPTKGYEQLTRLQKKIGSYSEELYEGSFLDWLADETIPFVDSGIRSGYHTSMLLVEAVNATDILIQNKLWIPGDNNSMNVMLTEGRADLAGGILRILLERLGLFDYVVPVWPFRVGFTYLAERESNSNMFLEPFSPEVWLATLALIIFLVIVQRITSKTKMERDGALYTVLTTYLQQDASAVPQGASGRASFIVLSVSAMLVHAYYTSAIVSALMSGGRAALDSLQALADSKYSIACEDYDYIRYYFFDRESNWDQMEYLKKKKMTANFYQELERGVKLIEGGNTAYHTEYNQLYPHFKTFSDDDICKLAHVDTIPETLTWITSTFHGQWTSTLSVAGCWILETGLIKRLVNRLRIPKPPCQAALLAERVKMEDVTPALVLFIVGVVFSVIIICIELIVAAFRKNRSKINENMRSTSENVELYLSEITDLDIS